MSALTETTARLLDRLPMVEGRYTENAPLAPLTWFRVGGPAEVLYKPSSLTDLQIFLRDCPSDIPLTVIGATSNLLVRDGGIRGVVIRLGGAFAEIDVIGERVTAGAAALDVNVALSGQLAGVAGLEFLSGVPGSIGGALRMNAGCYGTEVKDVLVSCTALDRNGQLHTLSAAEMGFTYRHCAAPEDYIFVSATFQGRPDTTEAIAARMTELQAKREASQPIRARTGGSTFANPDGAKAWELVDKAGLRGYTLGGAQFSEKHTNFLINTGAATATDIENIGEEARRRVKEMTGIELRWEIARIGEKL